MAPTSLRDPKLADALMEYTRQVLTRVHQEFDIPYATLISRILPDAKMPKKQQQQPSTSCASQPTKGNNRCLEYAILDGHPCLLDPTTEEVFGCKHPYERLGRLGEGTFAVVALH
jgi:hypothetical protein